MITRLRDIKMEDYSLFETKTNFYRTKREAYRFKKSFEVVIKTYIKDIDGNITHGYCKILNVRRDLPSQG
jgi:hypothetical protein